MSQLGLALFLIVVGYLFGRQAEKRHYASIIKREKSLSNMPVVASRYPPLDQAYDQILVTGSVVVASDYFKSMLAGLTNFFGGRVVSYESLLDRGRREAILRMKSEATAKQAKLVFNVKLESATVGSGRTGSIEVLAYGTAMIPINKPVSAAALWKDR